MLTIVPDDVGVIPCHIRDGNNICVGGLRMHLQLATNVADKLSSLRNDLNKTAGHWHNLNAPPLDVVCSNTSATERGDFRDERTPGSQPVRAGEIPHAVRVFSSIGVGYSGSPLGIQ